MGFSFGIGSSDFRASNLKLWPSKKNCVETKAEQRLAAMGHVTKPQILVVVIRGYMKCVAHSNCSSHTHTYTLTHTHVHPYLAMSLKNV